MPETASKPVKKSRIFSQKSNLTKLKYKTSPPKPPTTATRNYYSMPSKGLAVIYITDNYLRKTKMALTKNLVYFDVQEIELDVKNAEGFSDLSSEQTANILNTFNSLNIRFYKIFTKEISKRSYRLLQLELSRRSGTRSGRFSRGYLSIPEEINKYLHCYWISTDTTLREDIINAKCAPRLCTGQNKTPCYQPNCHCYNGICA